MPERPEENPHEEPALTERDYADRFADIIANWNVDTGGPDTLDASTTDALGDAAGGVGSDAGGGVGSDAAGGVGSDDTSSRARDSAPDAGPDAGPDPCPGVGPERGQDTDFGPRPAAGGQTLDPWTVFGRGAAPASGLPAPHPAAQDRGANPPLRRPADDEPDSPGGWHAPGEPQPWRVHSPPDDLDEDYVPPPPRPLPAGDLGFWGALIGLIAGPLWLVWVAATSGPRWHAGVAIALTAAGFAILVARLPRREQRDEDDDGAVV